MKNNKKLMVFLLGWIAAFSTMAATTVPAAKSTATEHKVGDCFGGGVVFYVNKSPNASVGQQGLIVAPVDVVNSFSWDTQAGGQNLAMTQPVLFAGAGNTIGLINTIGTSRAQAAVAAHSYSDGLYHDWYLPSQMELSTLYFQSTASGAAFWTHCKATALSAATYWSSTQNDAATAWAVSFAGGIVVIPNKTNPLLVRAIRAF